MKQNITADQLQQLSPEQLDKLQTWWLERIHCGDLFDIEDDCDHFASAFKCVGRCHTKGQMNAPINIIVDDYGREFSPKDCKPLLSIGQCIELLTENKDSNATIERNYTDNGLLWFVDSKGGAESPELIDTLWESVKEAL